MARPRPDLAELVEASGGTRRRPEAGPPPAAHPTRTEEPIAELPAKPKSREFTVPITVQQPETVRTQLKMLALEKGDTLENKVAEAFNDLFAKYGKPEIAVIKKRKSRAA